jgi:hypothetical protein
MKEFNEIRSEKCKNWNTSKTRLYRGQKDLGQFIYTDPKNTYRKSIDDLNLHITLMSNLESWSEYPKYESSVIGISSEKMALSYGCVYEIIPFDGVKIGICPYQTIWESFSKDGDGWGDDIYKVNDFLNLNDINPDVWGDGIDSQLKSIDKPRGDFLSLVKNFYDKMSVTGEDCYNYINDFIFNPKERGFELVTYEKNFLIDNNKQIWTNGPILLKKV